MSTQLFFSSILTLIAILLTLFLVVHFRGKSPSKTYDKNDPFVDSNGNHIYYERSIIEKSRFFRANPDVPRETVRTINRFFKELFQS